MPDNPEKGAFDQVIDFLAAAHRAIEKPSGATLQVSGAALLELRSERRALWGHETRDPDTFMGIPYRLDASLAPGTVRFVDANGAVLGEILKLVA